jgi:hypothetical protein
MEKSMATVGAVRIWGDTLYFAVVNGSRYGSLNPGHDGMLKAIADALWFEHQEDLRDRWGNEEFTRTRTLAEQIAILKEHFGEELDAWHRVFRNERLVKRLASMNDWANLVVVMPHGHAARFTVVNKQGRLDALDYQAAADALEKVPDWDGYASNPDRP